jgi:hypothetical protein
MQFGGRLDGFPFLYFRSHYEKLLAGVVRYMSNRLDL